MFRIIRCLLAEDNPLSTMRLLSILCVVGGVFVLLFGVLKDKSTLETGIALLTFGFGGKVGQKIVEKKA